MTEHEHSSQIDALLDGLDTLISLPEVAIQVNKVAENPDSTAEDMGKVISQDPALSARMLRIANSSVYGLSKEVDSISRAVTLLGMSEIRNLVLSSTVSKAFDGLLNDLISIQDFWHHSLYCGLLSQQLAKQAGLRTSDSLFVAGLLHDIGQLVMFNRESEKSHQAILMLTDVIDDMDMHEAEERVFGFDHMQVGAQLIRKWQLPALFEECVEFHHTPDQSTQYPQEVAIVHIANAVAVMAEFDAVDEEYEIPHIDASAWEQAKVNREELFTVISDAQNHIADIEQTLFGQSS